MAAGYLIALLFEAAGLAGLVLAARAMRAERRARASDLRGFLRSGQPVAAEPVRAPRRAADAPVVPLRRGSRGEASAARDALRRALARGGAPVEASPLSAG